MSQTMNIYLYCFHSGWLQWTDPQTGAHQDGSLFAAQGDLISLTGRMRSAGCRPPSLASSAEKEAYAKVAVASSKVRFPPSFP